MLSDKQFLAELQRALTQTPAERARTAALAAEFARALSCLGKGGVKSVRFEEGNIVIGY